MANDYGMKNVVIRNIQTAIRDGRIKDAQEVEDIIDSLKMQLNDCIIPFKEKVDKVTECQHNFNKSIYTVRRMISGYTTVFERYCNKCGFIEYFVEGENGSTENPEWTKDAAQRYWNNDI